MGIGVEGVGGCVGPKIGDVHLHNLCVKPHFMWPQFLRIISLSS